MGFISLMFMWMLWPIFLFIIALGLILPILGVALNIAAVVLLVLNILFFLLLLLLRRGWKQAGRMDPMYIDSFTGFRRFYLKAIKILFTFGLVWEVLMILACAAFLIFQPMGHLQENLPSLF